MRMGGLPRGVAATMVVCVAGWLPAVEPTDVPGAPESVETPADVPPPGPERPTFEGTSEVVASRIVSDPADAGRREVLVTRDEIAALPVTTVQDVLAMLPGVGLARRGARGVQGDLNLRGSTFEQALVMVNGVRVNNPQTGHHHLDLFVPLAAIERVEVLYGSGAAVHGPDAFGGAINIVTAPPGTAVWARFGDHDLAGGGVAGSFGRGLWAAVEREVHTGFRDNTEADVNQLAGGWSWRRDATSVDVVVAGGSRDFGAHAFYSARFPDERESTDGRLVTVRATTPLGLDGPRLDTSLRLGSHRDDFILDRARPDWFRNRHRTDGALVSAVLRSDASSWRWAAGVEGAREKLESTNLGDRHLVRTAVFGELAGDLGPVTLSLQARADHQDDWGTEPTWGVGGSWRVADGWRLRAHVGTSFRVPSFTDLYYTSPSTVGNPDLEPEAGRTAELGVDIGALALTVFDREADPIIDYLLGDDGVWRATNAGRVTTRGVEAAVVLPTWGRLRWQRLGAVWLDSDLDVDPVRSAYALAHPELEAAWTGVVDVGRAWTGGWTVRYRQPREAGSWATLDLRVGRRILEAFELTLEASNVFDRDLTELHGVPLPGRWVSVTASWRPEAAP
jgi:iron complex outermembrane receptor protein